MGNAHKLKEQFNELYTSLWPEVYRFVYYKVQNKQEAEELTQEIFHRVYGHVIKGSIDKDKIKPYIFTCARNIVYDTWKGKRRQANIIQLDGIAEKDVAIKTDETKLVEGKMMVEYALNMLSPEEREIILMRIIKGYSISYVSEKTGRPEGTVKSMQFRALQKLRKSLEKGGYFK